MINFIEELKWRGMIHDIMPGTEEQLLKEPTSGYIGFDPTSDSLHIGSLVQIMSLVHFQNSGHKPIILVGGATGMVGDPSGKSEERTLLSEQDIKYNVEELKNQLSKFLDFKSKNNPAIIVNNFDWFKKINFLDFIRDVGKHITVNYMMAKDSVKKRLNSENGMSFTEFSYQLVQGFDYYWLFKNKDCKLQLGGSDQWGNIVTGTELIRKKTGGQAYAITSPLIKKEDGTKFGKTEKGNVWLDANKTSPYEFYQYWLNVSDEDAITYIKIFTLFTKIEIKKLIKTHLQNPQERILQKELAKDITIRVHSNREYEHALLISKILFGKPTTEDLLKMDEKSLLTTFSGVPQTTIKSEIIKQKNDITTFLSINTDYLVFKSKGEARRVISNNGISINKQKINLSYEINENSFLHGKFMLVQKGKKTYFLITIE